MAYSNQKSVLDQAIEKYGGSDEVYKLKLKQHIREGMGYSNYINELNTAAGKPLALNLKGNITPGGVKSLVGGAMDIKNQDTSTLRKMASGIDATAGDLAAQQAAREKEAARAKAEAEGFENGVAFQPKDELDQKILAYMQNPKNPDGSVKSLQQFEAEIGYEYGKAQYGPDFEKGVMSAQVSATGEPIDVRKYTPEDIKARIAERAPKDFIGNEDKYHMMAQGFSKKQAEANLGALRYDTMTAPEKVVYEIQHPEMAKKLQTEGVNKGLIQDIGLKTDPSTGQQIPKYTIEELRSKYPNVAEATLKEMVAPVEKKALTDDISQFYTGQKDEIRKKIDEDGYNEFMKTPEYDKLKTTLSMEYGQVFSDREIDQMIYNTLNHRGRKIT